MSSRPSASIRPLARDGRGLRPAGPSAVARHAFITCASCHVRRMVSPIRPIPCESEFTIEIAPSSWSGPSAAIVAGRTRARAAATSSGEPGVRPRGRSASCPACSAAVDAPNGSGRRGRAADHVRLAHDREQVRDVTAARSPRRGTRARSGRAIAVHRVLELARLVQPVGVQAHRDVVRLRRVERRVDDRRGRRPSPRGP